MWFKYGLKAQKLQKQHALKGQKLLAASPWVIMNANPSPCKGVLGSCLRKLSMYIFCHNRNCLNNSSKYRENTQIREINRVKILKSEK